MQESVRKPKIFARIEPELLEWVAAEAKERHEGNDSRVVREALNMYRDLKVSLGPRYETVVNALTGKGTA